MTTDSVYLTVFISLLTISTARGNYGYGQRYGSQICDRNVYDRAKEMVRIEMQQRGMASHNRPPYDSRYPAMTNSYQGGQNNYSNGNYLSEQVNDHQCKLMRQAFDDLLIHTPLCDSINSYPFQQSADLILQSRKFLAQYCERNQGWQYAQCFKRREIQECENQYSYMKQARPGSYSGTGTGFNSQNSPYNQPYSQIYNQQPVTYELCQAFEQFRNCVITNSRHTCYTNDLDYLGTYFADKAMNASWSCLPNQIDSSGYIRRTDPYLISAGGAGVNPNYPVRSGYDINNPLNPSQQYPPSFQGAGVQLGPFPQSGMNVVGSNDIDRIGGALSGVAAGSVSACIERVRPYESSCLDFLVQRQREARYGRSSTDVQRRICCALFRYRDCLSRVVLERCFDNSRVTVDILMGDRNREITQTCRDITRDQCNGVPNALSSTNLILFIAIGLVSIMFTNHHL